LPNDSNAPTFYIVVDLGHFNIHSNVLPLDVKVKKEENNFYWGCQKKKKIYT